MGGEGRPGIEAWTAYWRTGSGASCFESRDTEVRLSRLWDEFVDELPPRARLLDLATGNGTVARQCVLRARRRGIDLRVEAVDAAGIDPSRNVADPGGLLRDIRFHSRVRLEALPFPDDAFDAMVSQFGFEYADEARAAAEAIRTLAPGGRLRLVMHARDGAVSQDIGRRLERLKSVLEEAGPVTLVRTLARAAAAGDAATVRRESANLAAAAERVRRLAERPPPDDSALFYASEFLRAWARRDRYRAADLQRSLEEGWQNASGVAIRQEQMLRAARSAEAVSRLGARLAAAGLVLDGVRELHDERRHIQLAWLMDARKPS